jgi:hypothetical protein
MASWNVFKMKCKHLLLALLAVLGMVGCKEKEPETYYVSQEMLRYCWFPVGSHWIYEEASTPGLFDSVYVDAANEIVENDGDDFKSELYSLTLKIFGKSRKQTTAAHPVGPNYEHVRSRTLESYSDSTGEYYDYVLFWDTRGLDTLAIYPSPYILRHDTIVINGVTYFDAIEVITNPPQAADWTHNTVWVRHVGLVRRSLVDGTVWNLVRYHIE